MMTHYININVEYTADICTIRFNRDHKCNAFSNAMSEEVLSAIRAAEKNCRAIVLTANPDIKVWSSGHDLSEIHDVKELIHDPMFDLFNGIINSPVPIICAIDGDVYAGGFLIALFADIVLATERSHFCMTVNKMGIPLPEYCYAFAISVLGARKAKEMFLCSKPIDAVDGYAQGLVNYVVTTPAQLEERLSTLLEGICLCMPEGLAYTKAVFNSLTHGMVDNLRHTPGIRQQYRNLVANPEVVHRVNALISKLSRR
ncbi:TPA: enoyl-CoA hydratase/isomerase family protein [Citrobacter braakii]|uniref:enoyl-CoA hydratase/isomerase family protein n=1 Tax=Citrobacter sp. Cb031 TaxID=2985025 RepID=UPI0025799526|nr:enoyl-CoA hydratase/isomerase family protein [Citrobacter sp. Cb031]MDM3464675.1 enoyl-CoA hydratase/isomerase family protein [Citrobacter sp. Cb031]